MFRPGALKSLVVPERIATILSLSDYGSILADTNAPAKILDLRNTNGGDAIDAPNYVYGVSGYHEGLFRIIAKTTNGQGATPTSPGASKNITLSYCFLDDTSISLPSALTIAQNIDVSLVMDLPDSNSSTAAGTRYHATDPIVIGGRYLYTWYTRTAFDSADALVDVDVALIRL